MLLDGTINSVEVCFICRACSDQSPRFSLARLQTVATNVFQAYYQAAIKLLASLRDLAPLRTVRKAKRKKTLAERKAADASAGMTADPKRERRLQVELAQTHHNQKFIVCEPWLCKRMFLM